MTISTSTLLAPETSSLQHLPQPAQSQADLPPPGLTKREGFATSSTSEQHLAQSLVRAASEWAMKPGIHASALEGVKLLRSDAPTICAPAMCEPSLCFILQGSSRLQLGDQETLYDSLSYLVSNVHLPVLWHAVDATPEQPYLAVKIALDSQEITELLLQIGDQMPESPDEPDCSEVSCALCMSQMDNDMLMAVMRLISLMHSPADIPVLAPLVRREILYRALIGEMGPRIRKFVTTDSQVHRISRVIATLKDCYAQPLRISELAKDANMSESTLFHTFKKVTRMSPLQYQKRLRLQEARRLMLSDGLEAAVASYRVGYESPSQFSREYSRMFGAPPRADVLKLRGYAEESLSL